MGNSSSKKARLEQLERDCAQQTTDLATTERGLAKVQEELSASQRQERVLSHEAEGLKKKCAELDSLSRSLEEERGKQISKLQDSLRLKNEEVVASRRVVESRTMERDDARRLMTQMEERTKVAEERTRSAVEEAERKVKELQEADSARSEELEAVKISSAALEERVRQLEEANAQLSRDLETTKSQAEADLTVVKSHAEADIKAIKSQAESDLAAVKSQSEAELAALKSQSASELASVEARAASDLSSAQSKASADLAAAQTRAANDLHHAKFTLSTSTTDLLTLQTELHQTQTALSTANKKLQDLTRTHNESVTRRTGYYEAFTATKQELAETQDRFIALFTESEKVKGEREGEKREMELLVLEVQALRARLGVDLEGGRKIVPGIKVEEVR